jgi:hypothetical protein
MMSEYEVSGKEVSGKEVSEYEVETILTDEYSLLK